MENYELSTTTFPAPGDMEGIPGVKKVIELERKSNLRGREGWVNLSLVFSCL